ncbi:MAG: hypothetical protein LBI10_08330 [Deltaproteobacteria bacterium]|nr:hypothetical protein [Deltaproteobacteria bacterium]
MVTTEGGVCGLKAFESDLAFYDDDRLYMAKSLKKGHPYLYLSTWG